MWFELIHSDFEAENSEDITPRLVGYVYLNEAAMILGAGKELERGLRGRNYVTNLSLEPAKESECPVCNIPPDAEVVGAPPLKERNTSSGKED